MIMTKMYLNRIALLLKIERRYMIKKIAIEPDDYRKIKEWDTLRKNNINETVYELRKSSETYFIAFDIADKDSHDYSVLTKFRVKNGNYIYEGFEII